MDMREILSLIADLVTIVIPIVAYIHKTAKNHSNADKSGLN